MKNTSLENTLFDNSEKLIDPDFKQIRIYFYKNVNRQLIPIADKDLNLQAKIKLIEIRKSEKYISLPKRFKDNWDNVSLYHPNGEILKANSILLDPLDGAYNLDNKLNHLTGKEWIKFTKSWFVFDAISSDLKEEKEITSKAGLNSEEHPATYSPTMMSEFISFFTKEGETVLDPFNGIGSTLVGCDRTNRKGIGIELNSKYIKISKLRTKQLLIRGNSLEISKLLQKHKINKIDFSISSPPYWNILHRSTSKFEKIRNKKNLDVKYSKDNNKDIGNIDEYDIFMQKLSDIYLQIYDYLKLGGYLVVIIKNVKKDGKHYPLAWDLTNLLKSKYSLKDEKIWCQDKVGLAPFGYPFSWTSNIVHHYCLIFRKDLI